MIITNPLKKVEIFFWDVFIKLLTSSKLFQKIVRAIALPFIEKKVLPIVGIVAACALGGFILGYIIFVAGSAN